MCMFMCINEVITKISLIDRNNKLKINLVYFIALDI